jgi:Ca2+/Na+ antiporter
MFALARLVVVGFFVLTIVYICLSLYSRSVRRDKLETEWREGGTEGANIEEFVQKGLEEYDGSLRRKLILGVYVIPIGIVSFIIYATKFM